MSILTPDKNALWWEVINHRPYPLQPVEVYNDLIICPMFNYSFIKIDWRVLRGTGYPLCSRYQQPERLLSLCAKCTWCLPLHWKTFNGLFKEYVWGNNSRSRIQKASLFKIQISRLLRSGPWTSVQRESYYYWIINGKLKWIYK